MAHEDFLAAVASQSFVNYKPVRPTDGTEVLAAPNSRLPFQVYQCLLELLSVCMHFARWMQEGDVRSPETLSTLSLSFSRHSGFLFQLLSRLRNQQQGCHLAQLLLRIDFNRFFSLHGHDIGTIA